MSHRPSQVVSGLVDGIQVLRKLADSAEPVSGLSLARQLDMNPVRVNRLLMTLAWMGIAHRDKSRRYTIGPGMHILSMLNLNASGLLRRVNRHVEPLTAYPYTVAAGVLWRDMVTYLYHRSPGQPVADSLERLVRPATHSSIGVAMLAQLPDDEIRSMYALRSEPLPGLYPTVNDLLVKIEEVRRVGYAALRYPTHISLAMVVGQPPYAAVAISGFNTDEELAMFCRMLVDIAENVRNDRDDDNSEGNENHLLEQHLQQVAPSVLA